MPIKFKKDGVTPNLSSINKTLRSVLKENKNELDKGIVTNFGKVISDTKANRIDVDNALKASGNSPFLATLTANIKYTPKGSIDRRSLPKPLRNAYRLAESAKKAEFENLLKKTISEDKNLSIEDLGRLNEKSKKMKNPFKGKFNAGNAA